MIRIGLIGEDPNDTLSIRNLLLKRYPDQISFKQLIRNKKGFQLNNPRVRNALQIEFDRYKPHHVLFIRDADGIITETAKIKKAHEWFNILNPVVKNKGLLLINIYELEALILADIKSFNKEYGTTITYTQNVMYQKEPKEYLMGKTSKNRKVYRESDCPELFSKLNYNTLTANCKYFKDFDDYFRAALNLK